MSSNPDNDLATQARHIQHAKHVRLRFCIAGATKPPRRETESSSCIYTTLLIRILIQITLIRITCKWTNLDYNPDQLILLKEVDYSRGCWIKDYYSVSLLNASEALCKLARYLHVLPNPMAALLTPALDNYDRVVKANLHPVSPKTRFCRFQSGSGSASCKCSLRLHTYKIIEDVYKGSSSPVSQETSSIAESSIPALRRHLQIVPSFLHTLPSLSHLSTSNYRENIN